MQEKILAIQAIHKTQRRIATNGGITMGMIMVIYFFTFAALVDRAMYGPLLFEVITSIAFLFALIFLTPLSFRLTKMIHGRRYATVLAQLVASDINKTPEELCK